MNDLPKGPAAMAVGIAHHRPGRSRDSSRECLDTGHHDEGTRAASGALFGHITTPTKGSLTG